MLIDAPITRWARSLEGRVIEVGCGAGERSKYLQSIGLEVMGIDSDPHLVASGRAKHPGLAINFGTPDELLAPDGFLSGVLAWDALDALPQDELLQVLSEFARVLSVGGSLLLRGLQEISWSILVEQAGLRVIQVERSEDSMYVAITAVRK